MVPQDESHDRRKGNRDHGRASLGKDGGCQKKGSNIKRTKDKHKKGIHCIGKSPTPTRASRSSRTGRQRRRAGSIKTKVKQPVRKITREGHITCNVILKRFACLRGFESPCCQGRSSGPGKRLRGQLPASILLTRPAEAPKDTSQTIRFTPAKLPLRHHAVAVIVCHTCGAGNHCLSIRSRWSRSSLTRCHLNRSLG